MSESYLRAVQAHDQEVNSLFVFLGARLTRAEDGVAELVLPLGKHLCQGGGLIAGGILATMADEAMAHAVLSAIAEDEQIVTSEMNIRYLRALRPNDGKNLTARARIVKKGHSITVTESDLRDDNDRLLAVAGATFFMLQSGNTA